MMLFVLSRDLSEESYPVGVLMAVIGVFLIITGLVQRLARRVSGTKTEIGAKDAVLLGVVQAFSALPGLSRSGLTVSAFIFRGYEVRQAMRVSFLMSIPVVLAAEIGLGVLDKISLDLVAISGVITALLFGILTIGALMKIAVRVAFWKFCLMLGVVSMFPLLLDRL